MFDLFRTLLIFIVVAGLALLMGFTAHKRECIRNVKQECRTLDMTFVDCEQTMNRKCSFF